MPITKRTHSNPCFWLALWNEEHFERVVSGQSTSSPRTRRVFALNVRSNKIIGTSIEKVHCDKGIGLAEIRPEALLAFCNRHFPSQMEDLKTEFGKDASVLMVDFENHWSTLEKTPFYTTLIAVAKRGAVECEEEIGDLACFAVLQNLRSHAVLKSMLEAFEGIGIPRFESYWNLRNLLTDNEALYRLVAHFESAHWTFYSMSRHSFPICDSPVLVRRGRIFVPISPRLLAKIELRPGATRPTWRHANGIPRSVATEYRRRCIGNTFKEIVFSDKALLADWQATPEFQRRVSLMKSVKHYNTFSSTDEGKAILRINAFGNLV